MVPQTCTLQAEPHFFARRSSFSTLWREIPKWRAAARSLIPSRHARRTLRYSSTV